MADYDPTRHHRRSIRLPAYDYAQPGPYFVTICTQNRDCVFGQVVEGQMILSEPGQMVESVWRQLPRYHGVDVDAFAVMPNHVHGIIVLAGTVSGQAPVPALIRGNHRGSPLPCRCRTSFIGSNR